MWISLKEPYNIGSLIHPTNNKIVGFTDPNNALLNSVNLKYNFNGSELILEQTKTKKLKTRRFLYLVESKTFIPGVKKYIKPKSICILFFPR